MQSKVRFDLAKEWLKLKFNYFLKYMFCIFDW